MVEISFVKKNLYYIDNYFIWPLVFCLQIHVTIMFHMFPITMAKMIMVITTLSLGLQPRQGAWKGVGWECNPKVTLMLPEVWESVKEWAHTLPSELPFWGLDGLSNFQRAIWKVKIHLIE